MTISAPEAALGEAQERQRKAMAQLPYPRKGEASKEFVAATKAVHQAERDLAAAKGQQHAVPIDFPRWDTGAPLPHLLRDEHKTFLFFMISRREAAENAVGSDSPNAQEGLGFEDFAIVEFERCLCTKMGTPNDEVLNGHSLWAKGLAPYGAFSVANSLWLKELEAINSVHMWYKPDRWRGLNHYVLCFHDSTFECVAQSFKIERRRSTFRSMLSEICKRFVE